MKSRPQSSPSWTSNRSRLESLSLPLLATACLVFPGTGQAQTVVQNDSITDFGAATVQAGFVGGERAGAWLTSPCDGQITSVRLIWLSFFGGGLDALHQWVRVFEEGTFPVPGAVLADLPGPVMEDGFENEFALPIPVPVSQNQTFVVGFEFRDRVLLDPSLVTDTDGCQAGRNGIFAIPPSGWVSACDLGVGGDFGIRAVVSCGVGDVPIFEDGFESGDTSVWSATNP